MTNRTFATSIIDGAGFVNCGCMLGDNTILVGCDVAGLARSTDFGLTWTMQNGAFPTAQQHSVADVAASKAFPNRAFAALGKVGANGGFARTTDSGQNWSILSTTPQFSGGNNVAPLPVPHPRSIGQLIIVDDVNGYIYALTYDDGVMRSVDGGNTWTVIGLAGHALRGGALDPSDPTKLYVLSWGDTTAGLANPGMYLSTNPRTGSPATFTKNAVSGFPTTPESIYVSTLGSIYVACGVNGVKKFASGAWTTILNDTATWYVVSGYASGANDILLVGAFDPIKSGTQFASLKKSVNSGTAFTDMTLDVTKIHTTIGDASGPEWWLPVDTPGAQLGQNTSTVSGIVWDVNNRNNIILTGRAGCYRTVNGLDFYPSVRGLNLTINRGVAVDNTRPNRAIVTNTDYVAIVLNGTAVDQVKPSPNTGFFVDVDPIDGTYMIGDGDRNLNTLGKVWEAADPTAGPWINLLAEGAGGSLSDTFARTVSGGWGTADSGSAWSGSNANYSVSPAGGGAVHITAAGSSDLSQTTLALLNPTGVFTVDWSTDAVGAFHAAILMLRRATNTHYDFRIRQLSTNQKVFLSILKTVGGVATLLGTEFEAAASYVAGDKWNVRFEVSGTSPTALRARAWREGQPEPEIWHIDLTDSEASLQATGSVMARTQGGTGYTANATFHWRTIDLADVSSTAGSGGKRPFGGKRIRNGSNAVVRVVAFEGFGIRYKVGAGAWVTGDTSLISSSATKTVPFAWAATAKILFMYWRDVGVYRSTDYGVTWTQIWAHPSTGDGFGYIAVSPDGETLLVSANNGLWWLTSAATGVVGSGVNIASITSAGAPGPCCYGYDGTFYYCETGVNAAVESWDGTTWTTVSDEAYRQVASLPFDIAVDSGGKMYVALNGNGLVVGTLSGSFYGFGYGGYEFPTEIEEPPTPPVVSNRPPSLRPDLRVLIDVVNDVNPNMTVAAPPVWKDFSAYLRVPGFQSRRGRQRPLDRNEAGTAVVILNNRDRIADKDATTWLGIEPMRHINVSAILDHESTPFKIGSSKIGSDHLIGGGDNLLYESLFDGWIEGLEYGYVENKDAIVTLQCVDILGVGAKSDVALGLVNEPAADALHHALNLKPYTGREVAPGSSEGSASRDISTDNNHLINASFSATTLREVVDSIAESDGGNFFIARTGRPTYRDSGWSFQPALEELRMAVDAEGYHELSMGMDETLVVTEVRLTDSNGTLTVVTDNVAQARYERPPYEKTLLISGSDVPVRADDILLRFGQARKYINSLDISTIRTDWKTVLKAELWDVLEVEVPFPDGTSLIQRSVIEGIEVVTPNNFDWHLIWWLSVPPFPELLDADARSFEGSDGNGTTGGWTAESNCTIFPNNKQFRHQTFRHGESSYIVIDTVYAADGSWVLQADALTNGNVSVVSPSIPVVGLADYKVTAKLRTVQYNAADELATEQTRNMHLEINWFNAASVLLSTSSGVVVSVPTIDGVPNWVPSWGTSGQPTVVAGWARAEVRAFAPNGAVTAQLRVKSEGTFKAGLYVDEVSFARGG